MNCPKCGKDLPDNAAKCKKCGEVFKENVGNAEMEEYLKKEKEKAKRLKEKKAKKSGKKKINKKFVAAICVALVICITLGLLYNFDIIGNKKPTVDNDGETPKTAFDIEYTFKDVKDSEAVLTFGDVNISAAEYEFFYRQSYSTLQNNAQLSFKDYVSKKLGEEYDQNKDYTDEYLEEFLEETPNTFDFMSAIDEQDTMAKDSKTSKEISWNAYIRQDAINTLKNYRVKFELAQKMGLKLTDDVRVQVYDHIEGLRTAVTQGGYSNLDQYLKILFGESCNEEFFKNELIREYMATKYDSEIKSKYMSQYKSDEVKAIYETDYMDYDFVDLYIYEVTGDKAVADSIASQTKDLYSFSTAITKHVGDKQSYTDMPGVPKYYIDGTYSEELGQWAFERQRKSGDITVMKTKNGYGVAYLLTPVYSKDECVTYNEIVFNKTDTTNSRPYTEEELEPIRKQAEDVYKQWKKGDKTADTFAYFAITDSQGNTASSGGLNQGSAVNEIRAEELKKWLTDAKRKSGDHALVEDEDAIRIVYFRHKYEKYWDYAIRSTKAGEKAAGELSNANDKTFKEQYTNDILIPYEDKYIESISRIYLGQ